MIRFSYTDEHSEDRADTVVMTLRNDDMTHRELALRFTEFLRGCGYVFDCLQSLKLAHEDSYILTKEEFLEIRYDYEAEIEKLESEITKLKTKLSKKKQEKGKK